MHNNNVSSLSSYTGSLGLYIALAVGLKLLLAMLFTSEFKQLLFVPFVEQFILYGGNPYDLSLYQEGQFPYPPLMLYILSFFHAPYLWLFEGNLLLENLFFKLPIFLADVTMLGLLFHLFPHHKLNAVGFYFLNPIVLYSSYIHSQLDLIPMAFLFASVVFLLKKRYILSSVLIGCAITVKFHTIIALPLMAIYILRLANIRTVILFVMVPFVVYGLIALPYIFTEDYIRMVLLNDKQSLIFDSFYEVGTLNVYLPILSVLIIYALFMTYRRISPDLLFLFLGLLFSVFILFVFPSPGWYVWFIPFLSLFFIHYNRQDYRNILFYLALNLSYLIYFLFFYPSSLEDILFMDRVIDLKYEHATVGNIFFTLLEAMVIINSYIFYRSANETRVHKASSVLTFGIGGDSAVGKSTILDDMKRIFSHQLLDLEGDGEHKWERGDKNWDRYTHLNPKANDIHKQANDILSLKQGRSIRIKHYHHDTGTFSQDYEVQSRPYVVLSGLHPFYLPKMRKLIDIKIYMDTQENLRQHWKILRDKTQRGYSTQQVLNQIQSRREDTLKYIHPQKHYADMIVHYFTDEPFTLGDETASIPLKLKLIFNADIHIEAFIELLNRANIPLEWDYWDDLEHQYLILHQPPSAQLQLEYIRDHCRPSEELIGFDASWIEGYRGVVQLLILEMAHTRLGQSRKGSYDV